MEKKSFSTSVKSEARNLMSVCRANSSLLTPLLLGICLTTIVKQSEEIDRKNTAIDILSESIGLLRGNADLKDRLLEVRTPCSKEELVAIDRVRTDILRNIIQIASHVQYLDECDLLLNSCPNKEVIVETFREGFGDAYIYCVDNLDFASSTSSNTVYGLAFDIPDEQGGVGSYAIKSSVFSDESLLNTVVAHEEAHILFRKEHNGDSNDWVDAIGRVAEVVYSVQKAIVNDPTQKEE